MTGFKILIASWLIVMICFCIVLIPYRTTQYQPQPKAYYQTGIKPAGSDLFYTGDRYKN